MPEKLGVMLKQYNTGKVIIYILIIVLAAFLFSMFVMLTRKDPEEIYKKNSDIRVEVLNGCGVDRLALRVTNILRKKGFNVVTIGDTNNQNFQETVVIERSDKDLKNAKYFAQQIGCKNIGEDIDPALYLEVTLILGKDYEKIFAHIKDEF
jgi:hypothetical protein